MQAVQASTGYRLIVEAIEDPSEQCFDVMESIRTERDGLVERYALLLTQTTSLSKTKATDATLGLLSLIPAYHDVVGSTYDDDILAERRKLVEQILTPEQIALHLPIVTGLLDATVERIAAVFGLGRRL